MRASQQEPGDWFGIPSAVWWGGASVMLWMVWVSRVKKRKEAEALSPPLPGVWWSYEVTQVPNDAFIASLYPPEGEKLVLQETYATADLAAAAAKAYIIDQGAKPYARTE